MAKAPTTAQITRALSRRLLGSAHTRIMMSYYRERLPRLRQPESVAEWVDRAARVRRELLERVYLRGHQPGILNAPPQVHWGDVLETGRGYRIRKLRYEGYPGMWIPALLYEPEALSGKVPCVLNPNGHHRGGKAMPYKQARCINLAKRGILALNTEFVGMGELQGCTNHMHQAYLDLCGVAGVGVMYLAMKRGLDVLLSHPHADPERVAMTGLSGGGWQTAVLSALDERIRLTVPVSGHSPIWHRALYRWQDHGDLEQTPVDLCTIADYDTLTAMFAPRPALLVHSARDEIFRPEFTRPSLYQPARRVYGLLGVPERLGFYVNEDPGTHNYERDIRERFYAFLKQAWGLDIDTRDIPCADEIRSEWELGVGLPAEQPTYTTLGLRLAAALPLQRASPATRGADRQRLADVLRLPADLTVSADAARAPRNLAGVTVTDHVLSLGRWRLPLTEFRPAREATLPPLVLVGEGARSDLAGPVEEALAQGRRVVTADLFGYGEQVIAQGQYHYLFMECVAAGGDRPLGICTAQLLELLAWVRTHCGSATADLQAAGLSLGVAALCAAALRPAGLCHLRIGPEVPDTLRRLIECHVDYVQQPLVFCFGLLEQVDIQDLVTLAAPVQITADGRGPLSP
jgi:hypothetical protein